MTRRTAIDMDEERRVLQYMIASDEVCRFVHQTHDAQRLFASQFARTVATWIHAWSSTEPDKCPGSAIMDLYLQNKDKIPDESTSGAVGEFLGNLSKDWTRAEPRSDAVAKAEADAYFRAQRIDKTLEIVKRARESGDIAAAESAMLTYTKPLGSDFRIYNLFQDADTIHNAFTDRSERLFNLPGCLGELVGPVIAGDFMGILAPAKRGKSYMVDLVAMSAVHQGVDSLIIDLEMTPAQKARRLWGHYLGLPAEAGQFSIPMFTGDGSITYQERIMKAAGQDLDQIKQIQKGGLRLNSGAVVQWANVSSGSTTVRQIKHKVKGLRRGREDRPFLLIFDSGDYLQPENTKSPRLDQLDEIWGSMRSVSQEFEKCASLSPSHTTRKTMKEEGDDSEVAGDIRKIWKLTKTLYLHQTPKEAEFGIQRIASTTLRDKRASTDQVVVLQHLGINRPYLDSRWLSQVRSDLVYKPKGKSDILD